MLLAVIKVSHAHLENCCPKNATFKAPKITPKSTRLQSDNNTVSWDRSCSISVGYDRPKCERANKKLLFSPPYLRLRK